MSTQTIFKTAGSTSQSTELFLVQKAAATSPGDPITGLAYNTSSLTAYYKINGTGTATAITLATQTDTGAYSSGGFVETSSTNAPGCYRFDIPDACLATAGEVTIVFNGAANMATHSVKVICTAIDLYDSVRAGMTALANAAAGAAGGLPILGVNATVVGPNMLWGQVEGGTAQSATATTLVGRSAATDNSIKAGMTLYAYGSTQAYWQSVVIDSVSGDTFTIAAWPIATPTGTITYAVIATPQATSALPIPRVTLVDTLTNYTGNTPQTGDVYPKVDTEVAAIKAVTDLLPDAGALSSLATAAALTTLTTTLNATRYQKNTGSQKVFFTLVDSTDHVTRKAGITVTATRSLNGAAFGSATGTVTEVASGVYYLTPSAGDINADDVVYRFTGTACDPVELHVVTY